MASHDAQDQARRSCKRFLPERKFPFPKSLYAVEDALRFFVADKPEAVILDFFAGSGTTAHAVMRLNKQDGGTASVHQRHQQRSRRGRTEGVLREKACAPATPEWEQWGIFDYITKPRIEAAITGKTPDGQPIQGDYKFTDEFPMADGFEENVTFFRLNYLDPDRVDMGQQFAAIAPLLWLNPAASGRGTRTRRRGASQAFPCPRAGITPCCFGRRKFGAFWRLWRCARTSPTSPW